MRDIDRKDLESIAARSVVRNEWTLARLHSFEKQLQRRERKNNSKRAYGARRREKKAYKDREGRKMEKRMVGGRDGRGRRTKDENTRRSRAAMCVLCYFFSTTFDLDPEAELTLSSTMLSVSSSGRVMKNSVE